MHSHVAQEAPEKFEQFYPKKSGWPTYNPTFNCTLVIRNLAFDNWYSFPSMNSILADGMSIQVTDWFDLVRLPIQLNFVGFHRLLDGSADLIQTGIDTGHTDAGICGL